MTESERKETDERRAFEAAALENFTEYFVRNYPGPTTIIHDPYWHAPKIFRAACYALEAARAAAPASEDHEGVVAVAKSRTEGAVTSGAHCDSPPLPTAVNQSCTPSPVAAPPAGFKVVPIVPTFDMIRAGKPQVGQRPGVEAVWSNMLAAAPVPPSAWGQREG